MKHVEKSNNARVGARNAVMELRGLAMSFDETGNVLVADKLFAIANKIETSSADAQDAYSELLDEMVKNSQQSTANMLNAALAGILSKDDS